jgi:50S ribosomal subunit-associated GTPase HflX
LSFLRRLLGGKPGSGASAGAGEAAVDTSSAGEVEVERDRRLLREEAERLDDELIQRQLRYADRSWIPPAQGGDRRSDDREGDSA